MLSDDESKVMSQIPPYQMGAPDGGQPPKKPATSVWVWVLVGLAGMCVICGVLGVAIVFPVLAQARAKARLNRQHMSGGQVQQSNPRDSVQRVAMAMTIYSSDFDDVFPPFKSAEDVTKRIGKYLKEPSDLGASKDFTWNTDISGLSATAVPSIADIWMFYTNKKDMEGKYDIAFTDGHYLWMTEDELKMAKAKSAELMKKANLP